MQRNVLCLIIGVLDVAALVLGFQFYRERQRTTGIQIDVDMGAVFSKPNSTAGHQRRSVSAAEVDPDFTVACAQRPRWAQCGNRG